MNAYTIYHYSPIVAALLAIVPKQAPVLTVVESVFKIIPDSITTNNLRGQKIHLWNNYATGRKPTGGTWEVINHFNHKQGDTVQELVYVRYYPFITCRLRSQICTKAEFEAWVAGLNTASVETVKAVA